MRGLDYMNAKVTQSQHLARDEGERKGEVLEYDRRYTFKDFLLLSQNNDMWFPHVENRDVMGSV
jgi:hypothetical protein